MRHRTIPLVIAIAFVAAACSGNNALTSTSSLGSTSSTTSTSAAGSRGITPPSLPMAARAPLVAADSCGALLDHFKSEALARVGPWGLDGYGGHYPVFRDLAWEDGLFRASATTAAPATEAAGGFDE